MNLELGNNILSQTLVEAQHRRAAIDENRGAQSVHLPFPVNRRLAYVRGAAQMDRLAGGKLALGHDLDSLLRQSCRWKTLFMIFRFPSTFSRVKKSVNR